MLIDTHCHIYLPDFDADRQEMLFRGRSEGIAHYLLPAIDSSTHESMISLERDNPGECFAMMGLHPCSVKENYKEELAIVRGHLTERKFIAVGEIGLDFYWDKTFTSQQYEAFNTQIGWALEKKMPIVIHSRESVEACIDVVSAYKGIKGVFHCFSGSLEQAQRIIDLGFFLGIGGVVTFKNSGLDKVMDQVSLDHVILETDAPYLAPVPYRGKRNESSYIKYVVQKLVEIKCVSKEEIENITSKNAKGLFGVGGE